MFQKRAAECEAWEKKFRSEGKLRDAERMRKTREQIAKGLKEVFHVS